MTRLGGYQPLHLAARGGHAGVVAALLAAQAQATAPTTTGATALHFAAAAGSAPAATALIEAGAAVDAREPQWGQTPLMFAAAAGRTDVVRVLAARGADLSLTAKVVDVSARNREDGAESRVRNQRVAALQRERAAQLATIAGSAGVAPAARAPRTAVDDGGEPEPVGYADLVGAHGGLTALLLAVRDGQRDTALALLDLGADLNQASAGDHTSPLLMATINGHFDLAAALLERGGDVHLASDAGATPLYGVLNMQWAPKARHPQPAHYMQQAVDYLDLVERFLKAGADVNARLTKTLWYTTYNRDLLGVDRTGATAFWLAAYTLDIPAMQLLLKYGADPNIRTAKVPERYEEGGPGSQPARPVGSGADSVVGSRRGRHSRRIGRGLRPGLCRQHPPPRARWLGAGGEVPGRRAGRRRERARSQRLHPCAPRRLAWRRRPHQIPGVEGRRREGRGPHRPDHRGHGQRPGAARAAVPRDD